MRHLARCLPLPLCALGAALLLNACGGGDASPPPSPRQTTGFVVDGYLSGSAVLCDSNGDGLMTAGETSVNSTSAGMFTFPEGCSAGLVIIGGTNADTGLPFVGTLRGPAGAKAVTPLTTLLMHGLSQDQLNGALGLPAGTDVANTDPAATDGAGTLLNETLFKKTLAVQQLLQKTSEMLNGLTVPVDKAALPAIYNEVAGAYADFLKGGARLNLSDTVLDQAVIGQLVDVAAQRVAAAPALSAPVRAAAQSVNSQALAGVTAGSLKVQAEEILKASGAAAITAETKEQQSDTQITSYVVSNQAALAGTPTAESVNAMAAALTQQVTESQNTGGGGTTPPPTGNGTLLVSFDESVPAFTDMGAFGGALPSVEAGPAGGSGSALKIVKPTGAMEGGQVVTWGGVYFGTAAIPFTSTRKTITARVYSTRAGAVYSFKVESANGGPAAEVNSTPAGAANTWSTVSWTLTGVDPSKSYTTMVITPDVSITTTGQVYYVDQITLAESDPVVVPPPSGSDTVLVSFDEPNPGFSDMGAYGGALPTVEPAPTGGSGAALKIVKPTGAMEGGQVVTWGGTFFKVTAIPFAADRKVITARVYSTRAGAEFSFKVESGNGGPKIEVTSAPTGAANTWSTVSWDMTGVDVSKSYTTIAITPDVSLTTSGQTYWIDTISLAAASTTTPPPFNGVLATFDEATPPPLGQFGAGAAVEAASGPAGGGSGNAAKFTKSAGDTWAGFWFPTVVMPFTQNDKKITALVYSPKAGAPMAIKVEGPGGAASAETLATTTTVVGWQTLTWVFNGLDLSKTYNKIAVLPDSGTAGSGQVYYFDDFKFPGGGGAPVGPVTIATLEEPTASLTGFEGCWDSTLVNDPAGGTNKVGKVVKPGSGVPFYCGSTVVTVLNGGFTPIPFTAVAQTMTVRVWSPDNVGTPVRLKVEDIADGATKYVEADALTTVKNGWQTMTFNFAAPASGSPALNLATTYNKVSIFFDFGSVGTGRTYYFDDVVFVTGTGTNTPVVTFDERNYNNTQSEPAVLLGFGGAENSTLVGTSDGLPAGGGSGKAAKVVKNAGQPWAGTSMQRRANDAVPTIPFATGATKMSVRVYSAYAGVRVHLKVEQSGRPDINSEVDACTTLTNAWETLVFDFGPAGMHFVPGGPCPGGYQTDPSKPGYQPTAQLDVSKVYNKVNIFFDYGLGDAGYDAMPGERTYYFDEVKFIGN